MKQWKQISIAFASITVAFSLVPSAFAQRGVAMSRPMVVRPHRSPSSSARSANLGSAPFLGSSGFVGSLGFNAFGNGEGIFPGLGLGLGYGFYPGTQGLINAVINPVTQLQLAVAQRLIRENPGLFGYGGYYLLDGGGGYVVPSEEPAPEQQPQQQQPHVIVLQQAPAQQNASSAAQPQAESPIPDEGQFTLVLRDGKQVQAVAFTELNGRIIYITTDGSRRTIAADELDQDATVRVNEERGTPLQLPL